MNISNFVGPKSICQCGHTGDGENSEHGPTVAQGHGRCNVPGCLCAHFRWKAYTLAFDKFIQSERKK